LYRYPRDQGVGLSDKGSSGKGQSNLTKIPKQGDSAHRSAFEGVPCLMNATHTYGPPLRLLVPSFQSDVNVFKKKTGKHIEMQRKSFFVSSLGRYHLRDRGLMEG